MIRLPPSDAELRREVSVEDEVRRLAELNASLRDENESLRRRVAELDLYVQLAYLDHLTGLHNRRYLEKRLSEEISRARRYPEQVFSLVLTDIDNFKRVNDVYGHAAGDEVLRWLAGFLRRCTRTPDICCRLAGDEFVVVLTNTRAEGCGFLVDRIRRGLAEANVEREVPIWISVGSATLGIDGETAETLLHRADQRMYADKQRNKRRNRSPGDSPLSPTALPLPRRAPRLPM